MPQQQQQQPPETQQSGGASGKAAATGSKAGGPDAAAGIAVKPEPGVPAPVPNGAATRGADGWGEGDWDDDFQIQLSEPPSLASRQPAGTAGHAPPPAPQRPAGSVHKQPTTEVAAAALQRAANEAGSGSSAETAVAAAQALADAQQQQQLHLEQQQQQQQGVEPPAEAEASVTSGSPSPLPALDTAGTRGAAEQHQQQRDKRQRECSSEHVPAGEEQQQQQHASKKPRVAAHHSPALQPAAAPGEQLPSAAGLSKPPLQLESPTLPKGLTLPPHPSKLLGKRPREQLPSPPAGLPPPPSDFHSPARLQQPSAQLPGSHQQLQRQPQLPRQASLQLPPRRVSPGQGKPSPQSRQATASPASQQQVAAPAAASAEQQRATPSPQQQRQQPLQPPQFNPGPQAWQQGLASLLGQVGHKREVMAGVWTEHCWCGSQPAACAPACRC